MSRRRTYRIELIDSTGIPIITWAEGYTPLSRLIAAYRGATGARSVKLALETENYRVCLAGELLGDVAAEDGPPEGEVVRFWVVDGNEPADYVRESEEWEEDAETRHEDANEDSETREEVATEDNSLREAAGEIPVCDVGSEDEVGQDDDDDSTALSRAMRETGSTNDGNGGLASVAAANQLAAGQVEGRDTVDEVREDDARGMECHHTEGSSAALNEAVGQDSVIGAVKSGLSAGRAGEGIAAERFARSAPTLHLVVQEGLGHSSKQSNNVDMEDVLLVVGDLMEKVADESGGEREEVSADESPTLLKAVLEEHSIVWDDLEYEAEVSDLEPQDVDLEGDGAEKDRTDVTEAGLSTIIEEDERDLTYREESGKGVGDGVQMDVAANELVMAGVGREEEEKKEDPPTSPQATADSGIGETGTIAVAVEAALKNDVPADEVIMQGEDEK